VQTEPFNNSALLTPQHMYTFIVRNDLSFGISRNIYFAKFQSLVRDGIILWGGEKESSKVLNMQKRALCIMEGLNSRKSCRPIFKELRIFTVTSVYFLGVVLFSKIYIRLEIQVYVIIYSHSIDPSLQETKE
jgi:hypothetical protein